MHCSSHLDVEDDDPNVGANFSIEKLRESQEGLHTIPSTVHGAPVSAQVSQAFSLLDQCILILAVEPIKQ